MKEIKEGDWVECEGGFCLLSKIEKVFRDSFKGSFFIKSIDGNNYISLGSFYWKRERISCKISNKAILKELEESYAKS